MTPEIASILTSVVTAVATILAVVVTNRSTAKANEIKLESQMQNFQKSIDQIDSRIEKLSNEISEIHDIKREIAVLHERVDNVESTVSDIKNRT